MNTTDLACPLCGMTATGLRDNDVKALQASHAHLVTLDGRIK